MDASIICPFFLQGGRYTIEDIHYVADGDQYVFCHAFPCAVHIPLEKLEIASADVNTVVDNDICRLVPAGDTEFAKDAAFGYKSSNLREV